MNPLYPAVAAQAKLRCEYCHAPQPLASGRFEVEHIQPSVEGGTNDVATNLALACTACNKYKGKATSAVDPDTKNVVPLFHPRTDDWKEHFEYDEATNHVMGRTPTGRATVIRLQLNDEIQTDARPYWRLLKLFP